MTPDLASLTFKQKHSPAINMTQTTAIVLATMWSLIFLRTVTETCGLVLKTVAYSYSILQQEPSINMCAIQTIHKPSSITPSPVLWKMPAAIYGLVHTTEG